MAQKYFIYTHLKQFFSVSNLKINSVNHIAVHCVLNHLLENSVSLQFD